jgi:hypothetical protein
VSTSVPKEPLRALLASISGLPSAFIIWEGEPKGPVDQSQLARRMILGVVARRRVGEDEEKRAYVPDPANLPDGLLLQLTFSGNRALTISVRVENYAQEEGFDYLENIRTMLGADDVRATLNVSSLSLASVADIRQFDSTAGNRKISVAQMDVLLNQRVEKVVTKVGDTYIDTLSGDLDADGAPLVAP